MQHALHSCVFRRLQGFDGARIEVPAHDLEWDGRESDGHPQQQSFAVIIIALPPQHSHRIDRRRAETRYDVAGQDHVSRLVGRAGVEDGRERIDAGHLPVDELETRRRIHPGVRADHEPGRGDAADEDGERGEPVDQGREPFRPVEIDAEEDALDKEGEALQRKRQSDDGAGVLREGGPEQAQLELNDSA